MRENRLSQMILRGMLIIVCVVLTTVALADAASPDKPYAPLAKDGSNAGPVPHSMPLLVDVGADQCIPCKMMAPILDELKNEYAGVLEVKFVDAWKKPEEATKYRVRGIPTQIFYDASGKELGRHLGYISKEDILRGFTQFGVLLGKPGNK